MSTKKKRIVIYSIIAILIIVIGILLFLLLKDGGNINWLNPDNDATNWNGNQQINYGGNNAPAIAIPGYDSLELTSGETLQKVNFHNPKENDCLFLMSLVVDGKELWHSGYIEPGKGYYQIELSEPLAAGDYNGYLLIRCFFSDGTVLNSAKIDFQNITVR